jgi:hypothetical protein
MSAQGSSRDRNFNSLSVSAPPRLSVEADARDSITSSGASSGPSGNPGDRSENQENGVISAPLMSTGPQDDIPQEVSRNAAKRGGAVTYDDPLLSVRRDIEGFQLPDHVLYSTEALNFSDRDEARTAVWNRKTGWIERKNDNSIPKNHNQRRAWVLCLKLAMKNRQGVMDKSPSRWKEDAPYHYLENDMERVCWDVVHSAEQLHLYGLSCFPIYDPSTYDNLRKDSQLTFQKRMEYLIENLCFFNLKCNAILKGEGVELLVAGLRVKLTMASGNRKQNVHRSEQQRLGKAVMHEREKAQGLTKADVIDLSGEDEHEVVDNSDRHHKGNIRTEADSITATPKPQQESHDDTVKENPSEPTLFLAETKLLGASFASLRASKRASPDELGDPEPKRSRIPPPRQ